jgi:hypothetical protein
MSDNAQPLRNGEDDGAGLPPRDEAADQKKLDDLATWAPSPQPSPPPNNVMLHAYGSLSDRHAGLLREMKDGGLGLWNLLRLADESGTDEAWNSRELETAATRLEEALLWAEKHFVM